MALVALGGSGSVAECTVYARTVQAAVQCTVYGPSNVLSDPGFLSTQKPGNAVLPAVRVTVILVLPGGSRNIVFHIRYGGFIIT